MGRFFERVTPCSSLFSFPWSIVTVEANPITGSVLLLIEPGQGIELESVSRGLFSLKSDKGRQGTLRQKAALSLRDFDRKVKGFTGGELEPAQPCICRSARNGNLSAQYREYYRSCPVRSLLVRDDYSILRPAPCLKDRRLVLEETRERK